MYRKPSTFRFVVLQYHNKDFYRSRGPGTNKNYIPALKLSYEDMATAVIDFYPKKMNQLNHIRPGVLLEM
jgi:hypothetical protein